MRKIIIRFKQKHNNANDLHIILDSNDVGIIRPDSTGTIEINDDDHLIGFMYPVPAFGGEPVPIHSEKIEIPMTPDNDETYYYNVSIVNQAKLSNIFIGSFKDMFKSKQERLNIAANRDFKIVVERVANIL